MIYIIGIGIKGKESLAPDALKIIGRAGLIAGGKRHLEEFRELDAKKVPIGGSLEEVSVSISEYLRTSKRPAVVLATGDPLLFGIAGYIIRKFGKAKVEVIPNVSTIQEAFARIKENWNGAKVLSAHGRNIDMGSLCREIIENEKTALFTDPENSPAKIAKALVDKGSEGFTAYVCESLGTKEEKVTKETLKSLSKRKQFAPLNVLILVNENKKSDKPLTFGIPDNEFSHASGMITKEEFRVISLSKMALKPKDTVWDIGSCSGSVAIEAARFAFAGKVYAIEKEKRRIRDIGKNIKKFDVENVEVIHGAAPACLEGLASPDVAFIGGGGAGISDILDFVSTRLKKGGRVVVNAVTMETAERSFDFLKKKGWERELLLVNLSKSRSVGGLNMLAANNPLFIIKGIKP